jgi:hypothetical protein
MSEAYPGQTKFRRQLARDERRRALRRQVGTVLIRAHAVFVLAVVIGMSVLIYRAAASEQWDKATFLLVATLAYAYANDRQRS